MATKAFEADAIHDVHEAAEVSKIFVCDVELEALSFLPPHFPWKIGVFLNQVSCEPERG